MTFTFDCPNGCTWETRLLSRHGIPFDGIACPAHHLFCKRRGGPTLWPFWKVRPKGRH